MLKVQPQGALLGFSKHKDTKPVGLGDLGLGTLLWPSISSSGPCPKPGIQPGGTSSTSCTSVSHEIPVLLSWAWLRRCLMALCRRGHKEICTTPPLGEERMGKSKKSDSEAGADASQAPEGTKARRRTEVTEGLDHGLNFHIHPSNKQHPYALQLLKLLKPKMICCHPSLSQPVPGTSRLDLPLTPAPCSCRCLGSRRHLNAGQITSDKEGQAAECTM